MAKKLGAPAFVGQARSSEGAVRQSADPMLKTSNGDNNAGILMLLQCFGQISGAAWKQMIVDIRISAQKDRFQRLLARH